MKRKNPLPPTENSIDQHFRPRLKKTKYNDPTGLDDTVEPQNSNENMDCIDVIQINLLDFKPDPLFISLLKSEKGKCTKEDSKNAEENNTYTNKLYIENTELCKAMEENIHRRRALKDVRKCLKQNFIQEQSLEARTTFNKKIMKTFNNESKPIRKLGLGLKENRKKQLKEKRKLNLEEKEDVSSKILSSEESTRNTKCSHETLGFHAKMEEERNMIFVDCNIHPIESLLAEFEDMPVQTFGARVLARRDPAENKWLKRMEEDRKNKHDKENLLAEKLVRLTRPLKKGPMSAASRRRSESVKHSEEIINPKTKGDQNLPRGVITRAAAKNFTVFVPSQKFGAELRDENNFTSSAEQIQKSEIHNNAEIPNLISSAEMEIEPKMMETLIEATLRDKTPEGDKKEHSSLTTCETEETFKEKYELVRMIKAMEYEKLNLVKNVREKEEDLKKKETEVEIIRKQLILSEFYRTNLHNYIEGLRGNLRIFCKVKPLPEPKRKMISYPQKQQIVSGYKFNMGSITNEKQENKEIKLNSLEIEGPSQNKSVFYFDRVFDESSTQENIFDEISPFIQSAIDGEKVSILAYGQTGSGKTYTMEGPNLDQKTTITNESGILPRAVDFIFKEIKRLEIQNNKIRLEMACLEIYNEGLTDLLLCQEERLLIGSQSSQTNFVTQNNTKEKVKDREKDMTDKDNSKLIVSFVGSKVIVSGLTWIPIQDYYQLFSLVNRASKTRITEKTSWNEKSSRSHCIYKLRLARSDGKEGLLNIVDLAGSERANSESFETKSVMEISRMKKVQAEANYINKSLTTLGRILRLISEKKPENMIPYRESKLTRILQDSLGNDGKTLMFINICPSEENLFQSKESLKFSVKVSL